MTMMRTKEELDENHEEEEDMQMNQNKTNNLMEKLVRCIYEHFDLYCYQMPILGYNFSSYDIPLIKKYLYTTTF